MSIVLTISLLFTACWLWLWKLILYTFLTLNNCYLSSHLRPAVWSAEVLWVGGKCPRGECPRGQMSGGIVRTPYVTAYGTVLPNYPWPFEELVRPCRQRFLTNVSFSTASYYDCGLRIKMQYRLQWSCSSCCYREQPLFSFAGTRIERYIGQ